MGIVEKPMDKAMNINVEDLNEDLYKTRVDFHGVLIHINNLIKSGS